MCVKYYGSHWNAVGSAPQTIVKRPIFDEDTLTWDPPVAKEDLQSTFTYRYSSSSTSISSIVVVEAVVVSSRSSSKCEFKTVAGNGCIPIYSKLSETLWMELYV